MFLTRNYLLIQLQTALNETQIISQKQPYFKTTFQILKYTNEQSKFLTIFNFQYSQMNQQEYDHLAELLMKHPNV